MEPANTLESRITIVEHDIKQMGHLFDRMDVAIEKITDISNCVNKMLAVHEEKLRTQDETSAELFELIEKRRKESDESSKELHSRITTLNRELTAEMKADHKQVLGAIDNLKVTIEKGIRDSVAEVDKLETRVLQLEKKQWLVMGAALAFGFLAGNLDTIMKFFS